MPALRQAFTRRGRSFAEVECPCVVDSVLRAVCERCDGEGEVSVEIHPGCGGVVPEEAEKHPTLAACRCEDEPEQAREVA